MTLEYHRPQSIQDALDLLARDEPHTIPLAGGTLVNQAATQKTAVVDLQDLALDAYQARGNFLDFGATLTLQTLLEHVKAGKVSLGGDFLKAIEREASYNLRQAATLAGTLVAASGRSPLATVMLALDAVLTVLPGEELLGLGDLLPLRTERLRKRLISKITIPSNVQLAYESVARSPADRPIVCAAAARWSSGRTRVSLGGYGAAPVLVFDGTEELGAEIAARSAFSQAGDVWASAEYREDVAGILAGRCVRRVSEKQ